MWRQGNSVGMDTVEDSSNDANRPEAHTTRMVTALTIQTVAPTMPPGSFMGPGTISYVSGLQDAAASCKPDT